MISKQKLFRRLALGTLLTLFYASEATASLLGDSVQVDVNFSVLNPIGGGTLPISYSDSFTVIHPGHEVNENLGLAQISIDVDPVAETIDLSVQDLVGVGAMNVSGTAVFSDLDWLDAGGSPVAGVISGAVISSNPGNYPFSVGHTDDSITITIDSPFNLPPSGTVALTISYSAEHIPEPTTALLVTLGLWGMGYCRRKWS